MAQPQHITDDQLALLLEGGLAEERLLLIEDHVDQCSACNELLIRVAQEITPCGAVGDSSARDEKAQQVRTIGRYEVKGVLGEGGMGVVYAAYDPQLRRQVALKLVRPDTGADGAVSAEASVERTTRLLREARSLAALSHPNVVTVYDVGEVDGQVFVATELVHGCNLTEWIRDNAPSPREVIDVFCQVARGLDVAHRAGIVHRDIKPDNILLGDDGRVRLADFGLATGGGHDVVRSLVQSADGQATHDHNPALATTAVTVTGALLGTPLYMAPEQILGSPADVLSDQFAFCVSLYQARYRQRPFDGGTLAELTENMLLGHIGAVDIGDAESEALDAIIRRGLSPKPRDRFAGMAELLLGLESAAEVSLVGGAATSAASATSAVAPTRRWPLLIAGIGAGAAVALVIAFVVVGSSTNTALAPPPPDAAAALASNAAPGKNAAALMAPAPKANLAADLIADLPGPKPASPTLARPAPTRIKARPRINPAAPARVAPAKPAKPAKPAATVSVGSELGGEYGSQFGTRISALVQATNRRDGPACLAAGAALDALIKKSAQQPQVDLSIARARCVMLAGNCAAGKRKMIAYFQRAGVGQTAAETDAGREANAFCSTSVGPWPERLTRIQTQVYFARANKQHARRLATDLRAVAKKAGAGLSKAAALTVYQATGPLAEGLARFDLCADARAIVALGARVYPPASKRAPVPGSDALVRCLAASP